MCCLAYDVSCIEWVVMDIIKMYLVTFSTFRQHIAHKFEFCPILSTSVVKKCFSFMLKFKAKS